MKNLKKALILLADGSDIDIKLLSDAFGASFDLLIAQDETKALEILTGNADKLDAVLLDMEAPALNGFRIMEIINADPRLKALPVIAMIGENSLDSGEKAFQLGAADFVMRPIDAASTALRVKNVLSRRDFYAARGSSFKDGSEKDFNILLDNLPGGITLGELDENGNFVVLYSSKRLANVLGFPDHATYEEFIKDHPGYGIPEEEMDEYKEKIDQAARQGKPAEHTFKIKAYNGKTIWIMIKSLVYVSEEGKLRLYSIISDVTNEKEYERELVSSAFHDPLTGLYNREAFFIKVKDALKEDPDGEYSILRLNIGRFKLINDMLGRAAGDSVLLSIAATIERFTPKKGICARFFADNFAMLMPSYEIDADAILSEVKAEVDKIETGIHDTWYYIGIYRVKDRALSVEDMSDRANVACRSINGNYNCHFAYYSDSMLEAMLEEQEIQDETQRAIENEEFCIYYQPVYSIKSDCFASAEALVRWKHPTKGMISPGKFIPIFERNGFIVDLDLYVLEHVCMYQKKRREEGLDPFPISVNISRMSLYNPKLFNVINGLAEKYEVQPKFFRIEITESAYNDNPAQLIETVNKLREEGFPILMDDFGSGYSSLNTLKDIPVDVLKLDMKFMQDFEENKRVGAIVTSIARMSNWLNIPLLAEGVETKEQYLFLKSIGCSYIQGFYFARPTPEEECTKLISTDNVSPNALNLDIGGVENEINTILGGNTMVSKLMDGVFGGMGFYEMNGDKVELIRVNDGYMRMFGYDLDDFSQGKINIIESIHPYDVEQFMAACREAASTNENIRLVIRKYDKKGKIIYLDGVYKKLGSMNESVILCIAFNDITEQIKNNELIHQSDRCMRTILNATGSIIIDWDVTEDKFSCFGKVEEYGFTEESLGNAIRTRGGFSGIAHPDDYERLVKFHYGLSEGCSTDDFRLKKSDGNYYWIRFTENRIRDRDGKVVRVMGVCNDVDAEKKAFASLEDTRKLMDTTLKNVNAGVFLISKVTDGKYNVLYSNRHQISNTDLKPNEDYDLIAEFVKHLHPDDRERGKSFIKDEKFQDGRSIDLRINGKDGKWNWISLSISQIVNSNLYCVVVTDISDLKNISSQLETLINGAPCGIALFELKGECGMLPVYLSFNFYDMMGFEGGRRDKSVYDIYKFVHPNDVEGFKNAVRRGGTIQAQFRVCKDGETRWLELTAVPNDSYSGTSRLYMVVLIDITVQKQAALKMESIMDNFDGGIALIDSADGSAELSYANDIFYHILNLPEGDAVSSAVLFSLIPANKEDSFHDIEMTVADSKGENHLISAHTVKIERDEMSGGSYIALLTDVIAQKAAERRRTMKRYADTLCGFYDEVFEVNYNERITRLLSSKREPEKAAKEKTYSLDILLQSWVDKYIYPEERIGAVDFFTSPLRDKDIENIYAEYHVMDSKANNEYKLVSYSLVKVEGNIFMMFNKDISHFEKNGDLEQRNRLFAEKMEENRRYEIVRELTGTVVIEHEIHTNSIFYSRGIERFAISQFKSTEFNSVDAAEVASVAHPDDMPVFEDFIRNAASYDNGPGIIIRMKMTDGGYKWCRICVTFIKDVKGNNRRFICTINIVDEEMTAKEELEKTYDLLNRTVKSVPVGVGIFGLKDNTPYPIYISDKTYEMLGIAGRSGIEASALGFEADMEFNPGEENDITRIYSKPDGTQLWLSTKYRVTEEDGKILLYVAIDDVSEEMEAIHRRQANEQIYQMLLEESGTAIFDYNTETDVFVYYPLEKSKTNELEVINSLHNNIDKLGFSSSEDCDRFVEALSNLSKSADVAELTLKVDVDEKSRWCRCFCKSISDGTGKVFRIVGKVDDIDDEISRINQVRAKAMYDSLCVDIYNKATTEELIRAELDRQSKGTLIMIDVDDFKSINDTLGHLFGDEFLKKFATTLKGIFRESDIVGRYGGDEFFVFLNADVFLAEKKANLILQSVSSIQVPKIGFVKSSIGIAAADGCNRNYRHLLKQADSALYQAKNRGKNCIVVFDSETMDETTFRIQTSNSAHKPVLSSNPNTEASLIMRVFSALYSSREIKNGIDQMMALVGKTFDVSRVYIFENSEDNLYCSNTFEWCNDGVNPEIDTLQNLSYKDDLGDCYLDNMNDDGIFYCHDISSLCDVQRELLERQDIKSVLQCAIMDKDVCRGFVGFDECRANRFWTKDQIDALTFISKILSVFLLNERSRRLTENYARSIGSILDYYPAIIYIVDPDTLAVVYMNEMAKTVLDSEEIICGSGSFPGRPVNGLKGEEKELPLDIVSGILDKAVKVQAFAIEWQGKSMYIVTCQDE